MSCLDLVCICQQTRTQSQHLKPVHAGTSSTAATLLLWEYTLSAFERGRSCDNQDCHCNASQHADHVFCAVAAPSSQHTMHSQHRPWSVTDQSSLWQRPDLLHRENIRNTPDTPSMRLTYSRPLLLHALPSAHAQLNKAKADVNLDGAMSLCLLHTAMHSLIPSPWCIPQRMSPATQHKADTKLDYTAGCCLGVQRTDTAANPGNRSSTRLQ